MDLVDLLNKIISGSSNQENEIPQQNTQKLNGTSEALSVLHNPTLVNTQNNFVVKEELALNNDLLQADIQQQLQSLSSPSANQSTPARFDFKMKSYKWSATQHRKFCIICLAVGWYDITPKYINKLMPDVSKEVISSHLQKTRNELKTALGQLQNETIPPLYANDEVFKSIVKYWKTHKSRMFDNEIKQKLMQ
ncbi:Conserved_hypothetical protein [Hexamita inflata]|uniref:Myb-like domain-containing protein n=1 Tax=Hexamita inflata TaxID=28002 RepID=A0ABP1JRW3_9EUKA